MKKRKIKKFLLKPKKFILGSTGIILFKPNIIVLIPNQNMEEQTNQVLDLLNSDNVNITNENNWIEEDEDFSSSDSNEGQGSLGLSKFFFAKSKAF